MSNESARLGKIISVLTSHNILTDRSPKNIRETIEDLGPTFVKMGQILSSRNDMLGEEYINELKKLRCSVKPMDFSDVKDILKIEYSLDINDVFESIDEKPIGSASIAQTHLGKLKTGETVAIKIQRKDIYDTMTLDAKLLKKAITFLKIDKRFENIIDIKSVIDEMYESAKEEMDFLIESEHIEEFNFNNKDVAYIKPLKVYKDLSTSHVLVMEYIDGCFINDVDSLKSNGYDMVEISNKLADNYIKQAIDDGFYHADPHPDNIKIVDGKIAYLDFGMMGRLSNKNKNLLNKCLIAILKNDVSTIAHILTQLDISQNEIDYMSLTNDINIVLEKNKTTNIDEINIKDFAKDMFNMLNTNNITLPKDVSMLVRGIIVIEGVLEEINPNISLLQVVKNRVNVRNIVTKDNVDKMFLKSLDSGNDLISIPTETLSMIRGINSGELRFNIELNDSNKHMDRIEILFHQFIIAVLDLAFIIGLSIMTFLNNDNSSIVFYMYLFFAIVLTLWIFVKMGLSKIKRK